MISLAKEEIYLLIITFLPVFITDLFKPIYPFNMHFSIFLTLWIICCKRRWIIASIFQKRWIFSSVFHYTFVFSFGQKKKKNLKNNRNVTVVMKTTISVSHLFRNVYVTQSIKKDLQFL